jgi:hypothetical protein
MTGAPLPADGPGAGRGRTTRVGLMAGVLSLSVLDVLLSPIFILLMRDPRNFSMTMLGVDAVLLVGVLMCFVCPIAAIVLGLVRAPRRLVLAIALLPVVALAGSYAVLKATGLL